MYVTCFLYFRKEIEKAQSKGMNYNFTHYIMVCKMVAMPALEEATAGKKKKATKAESWPKVYVNGEEEFFADVITFNCMDFLQGDLYKGHFLSRFA